MINMVDLDERAKKHSDNEGTRFSIDHEMPIKIYTVILTNGEEKTIKGCYHSVSNGLLTILDANDHKSIFFIDKLAGYRF